MATLFLALLAFFFSTNAYYPPAKIIVKSSGRQLSEARFYWDTGAGFNERESEKFIPYYEKYFENKSHHVGITRLTDSDPRSKGSEVWVDSILIDGVRLYDLKNITIPGKAGMNANKKLAIEKRTTVDFDITFRKLEIVFYTHPWAGRAWVVVDGQGYLLDLYSPQAKAERFLFVRGALPQSVEHEFPLPQTKVYRFKFESSSQDTTIEEVRVITKRGTFLIPLSRSGNTVYATATYHNRAFHIGLFIFQMLEALLICVILNELWLFIKKKRNKNVAIWKVLFINNQRYVFWLMFFITFFVYSLWLLGQWPGVMSVDSYHFTWREIKTLEFKNVTPWVYNLYVLGLTQFHDSPLTVSVFQICMMSFLGSMIFYFCYQHGARKWIVFLSWLLFTFSVPIGIYNITMWKDIPFNAVMLFWGFLIYYLYYFKRYQGKMLEMSFLQMLFLALALILLATLRHNGIIFLFAVPAILFVTKLMTPKNLLQFLGVTFSFFLLVLVVDQAVIPRSDRLHGKEFFSKTYKVGPLAAIYLSKEFQSPDYAEDRKLIDKWLTQDELRKAYSPVSQADQIGFMVTRWLALPEADQQRMNELFLARSLENPGIYLADRAKMFWGTLGFAPNVFVTSNELRNSLDRTPWRPLEAYRFTLDPKGEWLHNIQSALLQPTIAWSFILRITSIGKEMAIGGEVPLSRIFFNSLLSMMLLVLVLIFFRRYPASALYSFFFLYNVPFLFIVLSTCEWRYLYFLLLSSYFICSLVSVEAHARRKEA